MKTPTSTIQCSHTVACAVIGFVLSVFATQTFAVTTPIDVTVFGTMNIYGSGHLTAPGPCGNGGGILPFEIPIPTGTNRSVQFNLSGTIDYGPCCPTTGPDGSNATGAIPLPQFNGLAGCNFSTRNRYLVAVFLDDTEPMDPPRILS